MARQSAGLKPPNHLSDSMKKFHRSVTQSYELDSHHLKILERACVSWDRGENARATIAEVGAFFTDDRGNPRPHPAVAVELQSTKLFLQSLRELGLDIKPSEAPRAPELAWRNQ